VSPVQPGSAAQARAALEAYRLAAIVESSDDAIIGKDLNGVVTSWNRGAERVFGFTAEEAIGRSITMIIPHDRLAEEDFVLSSIRRGKTVDHFETVRQKKDGTLIDVSLTVSPIRSSTGEIIGASKIARDITEQKRLIRELEEASRLKDEFIATLSHELRTPLHSILGYTQMLRMGNLDENRRENALQVIERNTRSLAQMVSDALDVSRIVTGKIRLDPQPCDLKVILTTVLDGVQPTFDAKNVTLERTMRADAVQILGDSGRLQQVFWNMLTNAVKFTASGGRVQVRLDQRNGFAELVVNDTGIGIEPDFLPFVFDRFRQADSRPSRRFSGLGLGLALVRHFTELHGGSVHVSSDGLDKGTTFKVKLPLLTRSMAPRPATAPAAASTATTVGKKAEGRLSSLIVLAVDDDADSLFLVEEVLKAAGALVLTATSAATALRLIDGRRPDVIVADLAMPGTDGYELIRAIRRKEEELGSSIPAAALTAYARPQDRDRALAAGFQTHLAKPFDPAQLVEAIAALVPAIGSRR
jgi:PAS domain S-box-containing protein